MPFPPRSHFYPLAPIGVGTPWVESLTGYIIRLAEAYRVTPRQLVVYGILPVHRGLKHPPKHYAYDFWSHAWKLNGNTLLAQDWVEALHILTGRNDLRSLTLLPWGKNVSKEECYLRSYKAWCPSCYREWQQSHQIIYDPLLWTLKVVRSCLQHEQELVTRCPRCRASFSSPRLQEALGRCVKCRHWLGTVRPQAKNHPQIEPVEEDEYQLLLVKALGEALAAGTLLSSVPPQTQQALGNRRLSKEAQPGCQPSQKRMHVT